MNSQNQDTNLQQISPASAAYAEMYAPEAEDTANASSKRKRKGKKKKRRGLWIFLSLLLLTAAGIGVYKWRSNAASELLREKLTEQPFTFSGIDYIDYVTQDIGIPTEISLDNGKNLKVAWHSNQEDVLSTEGIVNRPEKQNAAVTLTAEIKYGLGKGKVDYPFTVVKTDTAAADSVYVLTAEEIESGIGENNLYITYDDKNQIQSIYGSFGSTKVTSLDDAMQVVALYRPVMELDASVVFTASNVQPGAAGKTFRLERSIDGISVYGEAAVLTTDEQGFLKSITLHITRNTEIVREFTVSEAELTPIAEKHFGTTVVLDQIETYYSAVNGTIHPVYKAVAMFSKNQKSCCYSLTVDGTTGEVLSESDLLFSFWDASDMMVDCEGLDAFGVNQTFKTTYNGKYVMNDPRFNLRIIEGARSAWNKNDWKQYWVTNQDILVLIPRSYGPSITNFTKTWDNPLAVSSYINLQHAYRWYNLNLGLKSFDGKGQEIRCVVNADYAYGNAAFQTNFEFILCGAADASTDYPLCASLDTMAHEYTHAVFHHMNGNKSLESFMGQSIDEAYADIFACLIEGNWVIGESLAEYPLRDPSGHSKNFVNGLKFPTTYFGENWSRSDCHINGILLSRTAYRMSLEGFSSDDIAKIWFQSMQYGYSETSSFTHVRGNVVAAARELGYSEEQISIIEGLFTDVGITDVQTRRIRNQAIAGDTFRDDTQHKQYLMIYFPLSTLFGSPIYILEEDLGDEPVLTDKQVSALMEAYYSYAWTTGDTSHYEEEREIEQEISVEYHRVSFEELKFMRNIVGKFRMFSNETISNSTGMELSDADDFTKSFFVYRTCLTTPYQFWKDYADVDYGLLEQIKESKQNDE